MNRNTIDAVFENGVFRPSQPVNIPEGERVSLLVHLKDEDNRGISDVSDLLDTEFIASCQSKNETAPSLDNIRGMLKSITEPLSDRVVSERDER